MSCEKLQTCVIDLKIHCIFFFAGNCIDGFVSFVSGLRDQETGLD